MSFSSSSILPRSESGPSLVGSLAHRVGTRDFYPVLVAVASPAQNIFSLTVHYFPSFVPGQAVVPRRLSLNMCLWVAVPAKVT